MLSYWNVWQQCLKGVLSEEPHILLNSLTDIQMPFIHVAFILKSLLGRRGKAMKKKWTEALLVVCLLK